ncbi:hypothetical protein Syun_016120 [Stephania yunnanensis]|uniref:Uncharacterized protein n=1 Tax=Stephania yunnanensis TaxID=152371 RepID=A0AAP0J6K5_9MAGN
MIWSNNLAFMADEGTASYKSSVQSSDYVFLGTQTRGFSTRKNELLSNKLMTAEEERLRDELAREIERELEREIMEGIMRLVRRLSDLKAKQIVSRWLVFKDTVVSLDHPIVQQDGGFLFDDELRDRHRKTMRAARYNDKACCGFDYLGEAMVMPASAVSRRSSGRYYGRKRSSKCCDAESSTQNIRCKRKEYLRRI